MKIATICISFASGLVSGSALAQDSGDASEKLRACSVLADAQRRECLQNFSRDITTSPPQRPAVLPVPGVVPAADNWIVSETSSPIDYTPIASATASSSVGVEGDYMQLSIQCRGGRTNLVIRGPRLTGRGEDHVVSHNVNDDQPIVLAAGTPALGSGVAIGGDVVRLLTSLPERGHVAFRVTTRQGGTLEGRFALAALRNVLGRMAASCKWPTAAGPLPN